MVHLRPSPVVARVMTGTVALHGDPQRWLGHEVVVQSFLARAGMAVAPSPSIDPGPYERDGLWMTFWALLDRPRSADLREGAELLGQALRALHEELCGFSGELPGFRDLRDDIERLRRQLRPRPGVDAERIDALGGRLRALKATVFEAEWPVQALHGDATVYNLLRTPDGLVWSDFEDTFRGPVHWDVIGFAMSLEFSGADAAFVGRMLAAYGWEDERELQPFRQAQEVYDEVWQLYRAQ
jgi:Ser/Thr protein kinase RdoA (MazF antagonist)